MIFQLAFRQTVAEFGVDLTWTPMVCLNSLADMGSEMVMVTILRFLPKNSIVAFSRVTQVCLFLRLRI